MNSSLHSVRNLNLVCFGLHEYLQAGYFFGHFNPRNLVPAKRMLEQISTWSILILSVVIQSLASTPNRMIHDVLSDEEFLKAGLSKLSDYELRELSGSLFGWKSNLAEPIVAAPAPSAVVSGPDEKTDLFGKGHLSRVEEKNAPKKLQEDTSIHTSIKGRFFGWDGKTVFSLENGQIWRQTDRSEFALRVENPEVVISRGLMGSYYLSIKGYGTRCKVTRVK
jgi:hypothetical protein